MVKLRQKTRKSTQKKKNAQSEMTRLGYALRALGGLGGKMAGGLVGMPNAGGSVGTNLGAALSKWLGSGDYTVSTNSIVQKAQTPMGSIPSMHNDSQSIVVRHKEYLGPVLGSTGFKVQSVYSINPGVAQTFPWLSQVASRFQEYRIKGAVFHYVPTSGTSVSGTNPALGSVMIQTSYRANDSQPTSKIEMMNEYWACEGAPSETFCHPLECNPKENPFNVQYVRNHDVPEGDSVLMYDIGKTFLATSGMPATGNPVGDLWVTYEVELKKPVLYSNVALSATSSFVRFAGVPTSLSLYSGAVTESGNVDVTAGETAYVLDMKFPNSGTYIVTTMVRATGSTSWTTTGTPTVTNAVLSGIDVEGVLKIQAANFSSGQGFMVTYGITVTEPHKTVSVSLGTSSWSVTGGINSFVSITQRS